MLLQATFPPEVIIVWSEIVPHMVWQGAEDEAAIEKACQTVNPWLMHFIQSRSGVVVSRQQLEMDNSHLYEIGLDIFLSGWQDGIEQAMFLLGGGWNPV